MKHSKKLASLLLAMIMVFAMATTAFAAGTNSITVNCAQKGETYRLYKMLDLIVNGANTAYSYTVNSEWSDFFTTGAGKDYVDIDEQSYVTWKAGKKDDTSMESFGKAAAAAVSGKTVVATETPSADGSLTFSNLDSGYYLITSTNGTLAIVDTTPTNPAATVNEKNADPTIEKKVQEDSNSFWDTENSAQIGDTVNFETVIHAKKGARNYKLHDQMEAGLSLDQNSIAVKVGGTALTKGTNYAIAFDVACKDKNGDVATCDFEIIFEQSYLDSITTDTDIVVTYTAVLNKDAEIADATNDNDTVLDYGDNSHSEWDKTTTKTFMFDIIKTDSSKKVLNGAKFELYDAQTAGNKIDLVKVSDGVYRVATATEKGTEGFTSAVIEAGKATVKGLDANTTYWLEETEAPAGYNKLAGRVEVKIENSNLTTNMTGDIWGTGDGGVQITNNTGSLLPSTGGMGTTIFYVVGSILVIGAAVLLITRKRMSNKR